VVEDGRGRHYVAGHTKQALLRALAAGDETMAQLADRFDMPQKQVELFAGRHQEAIFALRLDPGDELSHLWIAKLVDRLAELQGDVEFINETFTDSGMPSADLLRVKHAALKHAAEVLGQAMPKLMGDGMLKQVMYEIVGVDAAAIYPPAPPRDEDEEDDGEEIGA
jgi:hypothetical protein